MKLGSGLSAGQARSTTSEPSVGILDRSLRQIAGTQQWLARPWSHLLRAHRAGDGDVAHVGRQSRQDVR